MRLSGHAAQAHPSLGEIKETDASEKLPIRLLDVLGTISSSHKGNIIFTEGSSRGWDFHVISHTWSKGIRDLSEQIGKHVMNNRQQSKPEAAQLQKQTSSSAYAEISSSSNSASMQIEAMADAYSHAFKEAADFNKVASYIELREFLQLLAGDGVKYVWFDALCIDQTNVEEKGREIGNMGSYYHLSQGCYVLAHGVGEGYQLWGKERPRGEELPRWFSRVWTLQEFLLPRRLSFFVEALDPRFLVFVKKLAKAKSKGGLCRCFCGLPQAEEYKLVKSICDSDPQVDSSWATVLELRGESMKSASDSDDYEEAESFSSEGLSKQSAKLLRETWNSGSVSRQEFLQLYMQLLLQDKEKFQAHLQAQTSFKPSLLPGRDDGAPNHRSASFSNDGAPNHRSASLSTTVQFAADQKLAVQVAEGASSVTSAVCTQCQSVSMIREAQVYGANNVPSLSTTSTDQSSNKRRSSIYLVDREAYLGVMQCDSRMTEPPPAKNTKGVQELRSLYARLSSTRPWRAYDVVVEVGGRNCSVEEDRVLGMLGLLGKAGGELSQLRSGKTLQDQIRDLARVCSPDMLVELCGMDVRPCSIQGMSWVPDFHDPTCHDFWFTYVQRALRDGQNSLSMEAYRDSVGEMGALKLRAKVVAANVLPVTALPAPLQNTPIVKYFLSGAAPSNYPCSHFIAIPPHTPSTSPPGSSLPAHRLSFQSHTDVLSSVDPLRPDFLNYGLIPLMCWQPDLESVDSTPFVNFNFHDSVSNTHRGSMHLPMSCTSSSTRSLTTGTVASSSASAPNLQYDPIINPFDVNQLGFQMEMVLLAGTNPTRTGDRLQLIMLCLKSAAGTTDHDQELHKIGMLSFVADPESDHLDVEVKRLHFESASMRECIIGGFGADVSAHVHISTTTGVVQRPRANNSSWMAYNWCSFSAFVLRVLKAVCFWVPILWRPSWMRRNH